MKNNISKKNNKKKFISILAGIIIIIGLVLIGRYAYVRIRFYERQKTIMNALTSTNPKVKEEANEVVAKDYKVKPLGILQIPSIGVNNGIVEGETMYDMFFGVGWNMNSPLPNMTEKETGNLVLAAHDQGYAPIFSKFAKDLKPGDLAYVYLDGNTYIYQVYKMFPVEPTEVSVMNNQPDKSMLTMFTCIDGGNKRMVAQAKLVDRIKGTQLMKNDKDKPIRDFNNNEDGPYLKALREGKVNAQGQII